VRDGWAFEPVSGSAGIGFGWVACCVWAEFARGAPCVLSCYERSRGAFTSRFASRSISARAGPAKSVPAEATGSD